MCDHGAAGRRAVGRAVIRLSAARWQLAAVQRGSGWRSSGALPQAVLCLQVA